MENLNEILAGCFPGLEKAELEALARSVVGVMEEVDFKAHDVIFKEGDESRELYLIIDGKIRISKAIGEGGNKVLAVLEKGGIFGEGSLVSKKPRGASVQAVTDVKALKLEPEYFEKLLEIEPQSAIDLLMGIVRIVNQRLQYVNTELITLYEVMRILTGGSENLPTVGREVLSKISRVTNCERGMIFLYNFATGKEDVLAVSGDSDAEFVSDVTKDVSGVAQYFEKNPGERYKEYEGVLLWLPIKNFQGKFLGLIVLKNTEGKFMQDEIKLAVAVTDQLGTAVERRNNVEDAADRKKLEEEDMSL